MQPAALHILHGHGLSVSTFSFSVLNVAVHFGDNGMGGTAIGDAVQKWIFNQQFGDVFAWVEIELMRQNSDAPIGQIKSLRRFQKRFFDSAREFAIQALCGMATWV